MLFCLLPLVPVIAGIALSEFGFIDASLFRQTLRPIFDTQWFLWGYPVLATTVVYLRLVNSGIDQTIETFLAVEKLEAANKATCQRHAHLAA